MDRNIIPNGHIVYQAESPWDYLWAKKLDTYERQYRRSRWIEYPYNRTHQLKQHTITNEIAYEPIRFLQDHHNDTHYRVTDTHLNRIEYRPYQGPSTMETLIAMPLFLFFFALFAYFFLTEKPEPRRRRR